MGVIMLNNEYFGGCYEIDATLTANTTSVTIQDDLIKTSSVIDFYIDDAFYGFNPTSVVVTTGSIVLTFPSSQNSDVDIKICVR